MQGDDDWGGPGVDTLSDNASLKDCETDLLYTKRIIPIYIQTRKRFRIQVSATYKKIVGKTVWSPCSIMSRSVPSRSCQPPSTGPAMIWMCQHSSTLIGRHGVLGPNELDRKHRSDASITLGVPPA